MTFASLGIRIGIAAAVATSGISHAWLYIHGYQHVPTIGTAFLAQAAISFALAALILLGGPAWLRWAAAMMAGGTLVAFALSRTVGLLGFTERGWEPSPHAVISLVAEVLCVLLGAADLVDRRRVAARGQAPAAPPESTPRRQGLLFR
jgi:hypothetical protein